MKKFIKPFIIMSIVLSTFSFVMWQGFVPESEKFPMAKGFIKIFEGLERSWYDFKFKAKPHEIAKKVIVAEIDDLSLARYGRWPWPRATYAEIISKLYQLGAETVAFDVVFSEPEITPDWVDYVFKAKPESMTESVQKLAELRTEQIQIIQNNLGNVGEGIFGDSLKSTNTVLGYLWEPEDCKLSFETNLGNPDVRRRIRSAGKISLADYTGNFGPLIDSDDSITLENFPVLKHDSKPLFTTFSCPVSNRTQLAAQSPQEGFFNASADADGIFRSSILIAGLNAQQLMESLPEDELEFLNEKWTKGATVFPSLALRAVLAYLNSVDSPGDSENVSESTRFDVDIERQTNGMLGFKNLEIVRKNGQRVPIEISEDGSMPLRFFGTQNSKQPAIGKVSLGRLIERAGADPNEPPNSLYHTSVQKLYDLDPSRPLENTIVFIGPTSIGVYDLRPNPVDHDGAGVYLHATAASRMLQKILDGNDNYVMHETSFRDGIAILWGLALIVALIVTYTNGFSGLWIVFVLLGFSLYADYWLFANKGIVVESITTLVGTVAVFAAILAYKYFTEGKDRAYLKGAFEKYVSPDLVKSIISDPKKLNLGGEKKELSVLFSDVRGFTSISEKMSASELAQFMNDYLTPMTEIVIEERGTIDKYMGDAIMAIFGAPVSYKEHARMAVRAGLRMLEKLDKMKINWIEKGLPPIDIGVGVNTGDMSVGNMGSTRIFSYTVMGDSVNLGSRLEGLTKEYGVRFIVSQGTKSHIEGEFIMRELDRVKVKGKQEPVVIFEVLCEAGSSQADSMKEKAQRFEEALNLYYLAKFEEAAAKFDAMKADDVTSDMYSGRCALWQESPPEEGWDGSWTMKTK